jgi:hypothetical protein
MIWVILFDALGVIGGITSIITNLMQIRQLRNERRVNAAAYRIQRAYTRHRSTKLKVGSVTLERSYKEEPEEPQTPPSTPCCSSEAPSAEPEVKECRWPWQK